MIAFDKFNIETRPGNCPEHGNFVSRRLLGTVWSRCPVCEKARAEVLKAEREEAERLERRARWERKIGEAGIPDRFRNRSLSTFIADTEGKRRALDFSASYADSFSDDAAVTGRCALFIGNPGTGKTHLAVGIGMKAMGQGYSVLFCTVMRAVRRVKDSWGRDSRETESQAIAAMVEPDLLILDEVGVQFGSETEKLILFDILNGRYERRKPCLLLSNFTVEEVRAFLGERVFDRLREDGGEVIPFNWESERGKA